MAALIEINLDGLSEPASALINRVSDAVGGVFEPWQTKRVGKARSEAALDAARTASEIAKIQAHTGVEVSEIEARGLLRRIREDGKDQANIESVTVKAIPFLNDDARPEDLDEDFVRYLFDKARIVSDEEMQTVWAKILAGEANKAGTYSRRTIAVLAEMDRSDAETFTRFCSNVVWLGHPVSKFTSLLADSLPSDRTPDISSVTFDDVTHLESIGLIQYTGKSGDYIENNLPEKFQMVYFGCRVNMMFRKKNGNALVLGETLLTSVGRELVTIAGGVACGKFLESTLERLVANGPSVAVPLKSKASYLSILSQS